MEAKHEKKATYYVLATVLFWSTVATAFKIGLNQWLPSQLLLVASATTLLILSSTLFVTGKLSLLFKVSRKTLALLAILGFLNPFLYYLVLFEAYSLLPAQVAQPLNMIWPIVLVLLSIPLLKKQVHWKSIIALIISFTGVLFISSQGEFFSIQKSNPVGIALGVGSAFIWALFWILNVKCKENEIVKLFWNFFFATIFLFVYIALFSEFRFDWGTGFKAAIYIGLFEVGIAYILWFKALSLSKNPARIANLIYIAPFLSLFFIRFILKEEIFISTVIGIFFIISGILYQQAVQKK